MPPNPRTRIVIARRNSATGVAARRSPDEVAHPGIALRNRATGVPAARRRPGEALVSRRSWMTAEWCALRRAAPRKPWLRRPPRRAHPHPRAGGRGDGPRAAGKVRRGLEREIRLAKAAVGSKPYATGSDYHIEIAPQQGYQ